MQIECDLEISGVWTEGGGYIGPDATVAQHMEHQLKQSRNIKSVTVEYQGGGRQVLKNVKLKVKQIRLVEL